MQESTRKARLHRAIVEVLERRRHLWASPLELIQLDLAREIDSGGNQTREAYTASIKGSGQIIVGIDAGLLWKPSISDALHEKLRTKVWNNPGEIAGNSIDDDENKVDFDSPPNGWDNEFTDDVRGWHFNDPSDPDSTDSNDFSPQESNKGHGTATASLMIMGDSQWADE